MAEGNGYSRRDFLKIVGATTSLAAAGCGKEASEKLYPFVVQPEEIVPGIPAWYASTCHECGGGCGILIKTREGRAIKIEGNAAHPVNQGGLCARGQSALQTLYDPDRIREPLIRATDGAFKRASWPEGVEAAAKAISERTAGKKAVFLTGDLSGSEAALVRELVQKIPNSEHVEFDLINSDTFDVAAERCWGEGIRAQFDLAKADVILSVGADYLETWLSPVEFARGWASGRKPDDSGKGLSYCAHISPRFSLTAANVDQWIKNKPGSEAWILVALLQAVLRRGARGLSDAERQGLNETVGRMEIQRLEAVTGLESETFEDLAKALIAAKSPVVLVGGASASGLQATFAAQLGHLLNAALGAVGNTVLLRKTDRSASFSFQKMKRLANEMFDKKVGVLILTGTNPIYSLPRNLRTKDGRQEGFAQAVANVESVIALSTLLDETTALANIVLPLSTSIESWRDAESDAGVFSLTQPAMQPVFQTQGLLDSLISIAAKLNITFGDEVGSGHDYIQKRWKARTGEASFATRWAKYVETGGDWSSPVAPVSRGLISSAVRMEVPDFPKLPELTLLTYPTVNFFDGTPANRPWLQELPDPITGVVWGSWAEIHPDKALELGVKEGDTLRIVTPQGMIEVAAFPTNNIHPLAIAVPIGQGHGVLGRFSVGVGANALSLLSSDTGEDLSFVHPLEKSSISKALFGEKLVRPQGHFSQEGRELARTVALSGFGALGGAAHGAHHAEANGHGEEHGHEAAEAHHGGPEYGPPEPRPQMYSQMTHPLYRWGMTIDLASCTGCSACVVACYAENNIPVVGKEVVAKSRIMSWLRIDRYFDGPESQPASGMMPMLCQHCGNAPCEPVCPVYATYHNEEGINTMVYNRCVGTRYCSNNCSYKVRRFNWWKYTWPEPLTWQLNPDVTVREVGVMEKCTFCIQRIQAAENTAKNMGREVQDGEIQPACASSCPTGAITFGNLLDKESAVYEKSMSKRGYRVLDAELNTQPAITYLARVRNDSIKVA